MGACTSLMEDVTVAFHWRPKFSQWPSFLGNIQFNVDGRISQESCCEAVNGHLYERCYNLEVIASRMEVVLKYNAPKGSPLSPLSPHYFLFPLMTYCIA